MVRTRDVLRVRRVAAGASLIGACLVVVAAPFERVTPLVTLAGQDLSSSEAVVGLALAAWAAALVVVRAVPRWRTPITIPWLVFLAAMGLAAVLAPQHRGNAVNMAGRLALAFAIFQLTFDAASTVARARLITLTIVATGAAATVLVILDYQAIGPLGSFFAAFREQVAVVGSHIRASGTFQYPTIASMFLEVTFAFTLGFLLLMVDTRHTRLMAAAMLLLAAIGHAITLSLTRAGLVTMGVSLVLVAGLRYRRRGPDRGVWTIAAAAAAVVVGVVSAQTFELLQLRLTTEGQAGWYRASFDAPRNIAMRAGERTAIYVTVTNSGLTPWNAERSQPFLASYHWLLSDSDRVVSWNGLRTELGSEVPPGARRGVAIRVDAPRLPGEYRLMWDLVQEHRMWFSTEPGAGMQTTHVTVTGTPPPGTRRITTESMPRAAVRPGRLQLWTAGARMLQERPLVGVGPDNYRLLYGPYARLPSFDTRVHSNNMYIEMLVGGGLLGGLTFAVLCWCAVHSARNAVVRHRDCAYEPLVFGAAAAACAIAVHGLLDSFWSFTGTYVVMAVALGLTAAWGTLDAHRV